MRQLGCLLGCLPALPGWLAGCPACLRVVQCSAALHGWAPGCALSLACVAGVDLLGA